MRREKLYLEDIVEACSDIDEFIAGINADNFAQNKLIRSAVLQKLIVIGEAVSRLPRELEDSHPDVEWAAISAFRNRLVHGYFNVDWSIVWVAATEEVPTLRKQISSILEEMT